VKITADTNILLRVILDDEPEQSLQARAVLEKASLVAVPVPVFCELAWTMLRGYKRQPAEVAEAIAAILRVATVVTDRLAVEAGLAVLRSGGDFADGVIAWQGAAMGGGVFVSFDRQAVDLLSDSKLAAATPAGVIEN
jgi:predicted nucleic-acid-binding protein